MFTDIATSTVAADLEDELLYHQSNSGVSSPRRERATTGSHRYSDKRTSQYSDATSLYPSLHVLEMTFYFCAFWMGAGYSLYMFYRTSQGRLLASVGCWLVLAVDSCWLLASVGYWLVLIRIGYWLILVIDSYWLCRVLWVGPLHQLGSL